jgi:PAS domain S-box-containing protein
LNTPPEKEQIRTSGAGRKLRHITLVTRVTPYAMAGHLLNTTVLAVAVAGSIAPTQLITWCFYSYSVALFVLYRHLKNRGRSPRNFQRAAKKATIYSFFLALPWCSLVVLQLGGLAHDEELILVALAIGMAACGTVLLSAIPTAAFSYMSVILIPSALKCLALNQKGYFLLAALAFSSWGFFAALIAKITRDIKERQKAELLLDERNVLLALAGKAARVGSYAYDLDSDVMQISEGYAALHGLPEGSAETTRSEWRARVHPDDLAQVEEMRCRAFDQHISEYGVEYRIFRSKGEVRWIESRSFIAFKPDGTPLRVLGVNIDITGRRRAEGHQRQLVAELDHRVKNVLATVGAIVTQTQWNTGSPADFVAVVDRRIQSMARTHELLSQSHWRGVSLMEIVQREFAPYAVNNVEIDGPSVTLKAEAAQSVAMVLHELTTNAAKYGAFSDRNGRVLLGWRWLSNGSGGGLAIEWQEIGGPPVMAPNGSGYGTSVINELVPFELGGKVDLAFAPDGVICRMELPAEWVGNGSRKEPHTT